jgi:hypothetical protein
MSKNLKIGLIGVLAVALIVNGYLLLNKSDDSAATPAQTEDVTSKASAASDTKTPQLNTTEKKETPKKVDDGKSVDPNMPKTKMTFEKMEHNYGKVEQKTKNEHIFRFTNSGTNPLVIANAKGTCGCTVPDYPKDPIMPGEDGEIKVEYSSRTSKGVQTKMVNIWANTEPEQTQLKITADVQAPAEGS